MRIADHTIGPTPLPVFLYAEVGVTPMGDVKRAFALIDAAKAAGLDAVKFIVTDPDQVECPTPDPFTYDTADGLRTRPIAEVARETLFKLEEWQQISDYCRYQGIIFFATVDHLLGVAMLELLNAPAYKICAWDIGYTDLFEVVGATNKPVLFDVGTATTQEAFMASTYLRGNPPYVQGIPPYLAVHAPHPTATGDWNMGRIKPTPSSLWGFSSPGRESWCDFLALGRGAVAIEKRLTLNRSELQGHHHWISLEPDEMAEWVKEIRRAEMALREDPWGGSDTAWAARRRYDRTRVMPDGRRLRRGGD